MAIEGVKAWAKCLDCEDVCYTEDYSDHRHEAVLCPCGALYINDYDVEGPIDTSFTEQDMVEWLLLHTPQT